MQNFDELDIKGEIVNAVYDMGFSAPTPIQAEVIPTILQGSDCLAKAPTGSGKTCAFAIPALNNIDINEPYPQTLIMCPTRELAIQIEAEMKKLAKYIEGCRILAVYGGQNIERQLAGLRKKPQIIIGTPGRIMDHLRRKTLKLDCIKLLVLDEADEMLNMGFRDDINVILLSCNTVHQTVLFSATMPKDILKISQSYQNKPVIIETMSDTSNIPKIKQYALDVAEKQKINILQSILQEKNYFLVLVFCNTKRKSDTLCSTLCSLGYKAEALHGDLRQRERDYIMKRYRGGDINILVATDIAARGIDVECIDAVFNYDVPLNDEYYIHRIGRTARANKEGEAYSFFTQKDVYMRKNYEKNTGIKMLQYQIDSKVENKEMDSDILKWLKGDLQAEKELIKKELKNFNKQNNANFDFIDVAAALYKYAQEAKHTTFKPAFENAKPAFDSSRQSDRAKPAFDSSRQSDRARPAFDGSKQSDRAKPAERAYGSKEKGGRRENKDTTRYFLNIGSKDKLDEKSIKSFICSNSSVGESDINEVRLLDTFSFAEIKNGFNDEMFSLNSLKVNKRLVKVELAGEKTSSDKPSPSRKKFDSKSPGKKNDRNTFGQKRSFTSKSRSK